MKSVLVPRFTKCSPEKVRHTGVSRPSPAWFGNWAGFIRKYC